MTSVTVRRVRIYDIFMNILGFWYVVIIFKKCYQIIVLLHVLLNGMLNYGTVCSCRSYDRQRYDMVPSETSGGQHTTAVVTSPTSSAFARQHNDDAASVVTSGGQYSRYQDAPTPPLGGRVSLQRTEVYPDLTSGGQDINETDAEIVQDLRVNLPPDGSGAAAICDTSKDDILAKIWTAEEYLGVCISQ